MPVAAHALPWRRRPVAVTEITATGRRYRQWVIEDASGREVCRLIFLEGRGDDGESVVDFILNRTSSEPQHA